MAIGTREIKLRIVQPLAWSNRPDANDDSAIVVNTQASLAPWTSAFSAGW
jgi:hypothetical protein